MELPDVRNTQIYRIDPELLLEKVLGLTVEYQHLSYDGSILGMTSFTELGVQVLEDDDNEAFFFLDGKTVLVEKDLAFDNKLRGRKNFTLMHEGSHQIFKMLFPNDYGVTQKSSGIHYYKINSERNKPISDWDASRCLYPIGKNGRQIRLEQPFYCRKALSSKECFFSISETKLNVLIRFTRRKFIRDLKPLPIFWAVLKRHWLSE